MPPRRRSKPKSPDHEALGRAIEELRREAGLTQEELADRIDALATGIGLLERGLSNPTYSTLMRLAQGLGIGIAELGARIEGHRQPSPERRST